MIISPLLLFSSAQAISSSRSSRVVPCAVEGVVVHAYSPLGPGREPGHVRAIANFCLDTRGRDHRCDDDPGAWRLVCGSGDELGLIRRQTANACRETVARRRVMFRADVAYVCKAMRAAAACRRSCVPICDSAVPTSR